MAAVDIGDFGSLAPESPFPGVERRCFHSGRSTVSRYTFAPGARFPIHRHPEEQVTLVEAGRVEFVVAGAVHRLEPGAWTVVPGEVEHGIVAGEEGAQVVAIVSPRRAASDAYTVGGMSELGRVQILDAGATCPALPLVEGSGWARAVVWPGVGARLRSLHRISLAAGSRTVEQRHPMEAVYYVIEGTAVIVDLDAGSRDELVPGSFAHVEPGTGYRFEAGAGGAELVGGPCPPDPSLYRVLEGVR